MSVDETKQSGAATGTFTSYTIGFVISIILTLVAYFIVVEKYLPGRTLLATLVALAITQLLVQLIFFLHLGRESKPRWNLTVLLYAVLLVVILVVGTLWIMANLNYHMGPQEVEEYLLQDEGINK